MEEPKQVSPHRAFQVGYRRKAPTVFTFLMSKIQRHGAAVVLDNYVNAMFSCLQRFFLYDICEFHVAVNFLGPFCWNKCPVWSE